MTAIDKSKIKVSVCMVTYNHEHFLPQAIEGVIMQKTDFPIELIIGEDCSTDRTREICLEYKNKYPDVIKLNLPSKNQGAQQNFLNTYKLCEGKYVALCEGDDYWTDVNKLQKQVDFLEQNPGFSMSTHNSVILGHNTKLIYNPPLDKTNFTTKEIIELDWSIMTASILFRRIDFVVPDWFSKIKNGDYALQLLLSAKGAIGYMPDYMSVYRRHYGSVSNAFNPFVSVMSLYDLFKKFNMETKGKYKRYTKRKIQRVCKNNMQLAGKHKLRKQKIALSLTYFFSKLGVDIFPLISKIAIFSK